MIETSCIKGIEYASRCSSGECNRSYAVLHGRQPDQLVSILGIGNSQCDVSLNHWWNSLFQCCLAIEAH
jgi:hypothetical protein